MKLPGWFVRVVKPIYQIMVKVPVVGALIRKVAHFVLSRDGFSFRFPRSSREDQVASLEVRLEQMALVVQGMDAANRALYDRCDYLEHKVNEQQLIKIDIEAVKSRIEFVRDEVMFELRKSLRSRPPALEGGSLAKVETKVVNPSVLDDKPLRLNVGCGHQAISGYANVDARELPGVDVVADVANLPVSPSSVDELFASHLIEHFPYRFLQDVLLPYWRSLLVPGGILRLVLPDAEGMLKAHAEGEMSFSDLSLVTFGKQDYDGDFHFAMFSPVSVQELLRCAGFSDVKVLASDRVNGLCREMEITAVRGERV